LKVNTFFLELEKTKYATNVFHLTAVIKDDRSIYAAETIWMLITSVYP